MIDGPPDAAALNLSRLGGRGDLHPAHERQVDHQPVVADAEPGRVVASAAHGDRQPAVPTECDGGDDVGYVTALGDEPRVAGDHAVVDFPFLVAVGIVTT